MLRWSVRGFSNPLTTNPCGQFPVSSSRSPTGGKESHRNCFKQESLLPLVTELASLKVIPSCPQWKKLPTRFCGMDCRRRSRRRVFMKWPAAHQAVQLCIFKLRNETNDKTGKG